MANTGEKKQQQNPEKQQKQVKPEPWLERENDYGRDYPEWCNNHIIIQIR